MAGPAKPHWFRRNAPDPTALARMSTLLDGLQLHTVCQSAHCPNQGECFGRGVATFMILGDICTRNCTFCAVEHGRPAPPDADEPQHIVAAVKKLGLRHVVVTSVTRDDLADGGAQQFARVVTEARNYDPDISLEVLIPDFQGSLEALQLVTVSKPSVLNHNVETVPRLYPEVRPQADYRRSVQLLRNVKSLDSELITKSGLMLGLGEKREEVLQVMTDLRAVDCDFITIGQYLRPSMQHHPIVRFVTPEEFEEYKDIGVAMGFRGVASAPLVRSSFHADQMFARVNRTDGIDSE